MVVLSDGTFNCLCLHCATAGEGQEDDDKGKRSTCVPGKSTGTAPVKRPSVAVNSAGWIDSSCAGKNVWHSALRSEVQQLLDISIVDFNGQNGADVKGIIARMKSRFIYLLDDEAVPLDDNCIRRYCRTILKTERNALKTKWEKGGYAKSKGAPPGISKEQFDVLQTYWKSDAGKAKSESMSLARGEVKRPNMCGRGGLMGSTKQVQSNIHVEDSN